uniref:Uncharacterized protein n=1 Tax=Rhizophagus irregularis (strain DAOM 181602 / DAOM 197198 / MUCL 43194) TaxID=747089 RepID=U9TK73_RHIID
MGQFLSYNYRNINSYWSPQYNSVIGWGYNYSIPIRKKKYKKKMIKKEIKDLWYGGHAGGGWALALI